MEIISVRGALNGRCIVCYQTEIRGMIIRIAGCGKGS